LNVSTGSNWVDGDGGQNIPTRSRLSTDPNRLTMMMPIGPTTLTLVTPEAMRKCHSHSPTTTTRLVVKEVQICGLNCLESILLDDDQSYVSRYVSPLRTLLTEISIHKVKFSFRIN